MKHALYILSAYSNLRSLSIDQILQIGVNQEIDPNPIPSFDENLLINLCIDAKNIFMKEKNVLEIEGDAIIVGDIHGSYHDLLRILNYVEYDNSKVIFLGDYVDRGCFSLECITLLFSLKIQFPNKYFLLRGNHEFDSLCSTYGFKKEILNYHNPKKMYQYNKDTTIQQPVIRDYNDFNFDFDSEEVKEEENISQETLCDNYFANHVNMNCYKYTETLYDALIKAFSYLPIAAVVNKTSLCLHGGLSPLLDKIERINSNIQRPINDYDQNQLLCDILWGDPSDKIDCFFDSNPRGRGKLFNGAYIVNFLKNNGLNRLIRAHECVADGTCQMFNEKCITVFSASSYDQELANYSGILKILQKNDKIECVSFKPLKRLEKCDALYYKVKSFYEEKTSKPVFSQFNLKQIASYGGLPDPLPKNAIDVELLPLNIHSNEPIQGSKSSRVSPSNLKNHYGFLGKTISFNTGAQRRKNHNVYFPALTSRPNCIDNFIANRNLKANKDHCESDGADSTNPPPKNVTLPSLTPRATI